MLGCRQYIALRLLFAYISCLVSQFDLSMTFGSILAATDPVAVAVLLNELGAPPRLKVKLIFLFFALHHCGLKLPALISISMM